MGDNHPERLRVYRARDPLRGVALGAIVTVVFALLAFFGSMRHRLANAAIALLAGLATWRTVLMGARVEADGVRVVAFARSRVIPWQDIDRFAVLPWGPYPFVGHVMLKGDRAPVPIVAISGGFSASRRRREEAELMIDRLNELLAAESQTPRRVEPPLTRRPATLPSQADEPGAESGAQQRARESEVSHHEVLPRRSLPWWLPVVVVIVSVVAAVLVAAAAAGKL